MNIEIKENLESYMSIFEVSRIGIINISKKGKQETKVESGEKPDTFIEGGIRQITIELRRRDPELRRQAIIKNGGYKCNICGFNFEDTYGEYGDKFIEIHHLIPLHESEEKHSVTVDEVAVVCSNCHSILHHNGTNPIKVEVLKKKVEERRKFKKT